MSNTNTPENKMNKPVPTKCAFTPAVSVTGMSARDALKLSTEFGLHYTREAWKAEGECMTRSGLACKVPGEDNLGRIAYVSNDGTTIGVMLSDGKTVLDFDCSAVTHVKHQF